MRVVRGWVERRAIIALLPLLVVRIHLMTENVDRGHEMKGGPPNAGGVEVDVHMIVVDVANSGIVRGTVSCVAGAPGKPVENYVSGVERTPHCP